MNTGLKTFEELQEAYPDKPVHVIDWDKDSKVAIAQDDGKYITLSKGECKCEEH